MAPPVDPDSVLIVLFKNDAAPNPIKSVAAGRAIFDDREVCEIRYPGSRSVSVFPAHELCPHKINDPFTGEQRGITYAERFAAQYRQFTARVAQTRSGTPLEYAPFLTEARRAELRSLNIYTVEALSVVDGLELKNLGPGGREMKNQALHFMERAEEGAAPLQMEAELTALRARNQVLEDDLALLKAAPPSSPPTPPVAMPSPPPGTAEFAAMSTEQLRAYILAKTGHTPHGSLSIKVLQRMAADATAIAAEAADAAA